MTTSKPYLYTEIMDGMREFHPRKVILSEERGRIEVEVRRLTTAKPIVVFIAMKPNPARSKEFRILTKALLYLGITP